MIKRIGKLSGGGKVVHLADEATIQGVSVKLGDLVEVRTTMKGLSVFQAKVARIDLVEPGGDVKELTVGIWTNLNGKTHSRHGQTRTFTPDQVTPIRKQPRWALVPVDRVEGVDPSDGTK